MRLTRRVLTALLAAVFLVHPGTAVADSLKHVDATGDVQRALIGSNVYGLAAGRVQGDISSIAVSHGRHMVWIHVQLRELTTTTNGNFHRIGIKSDRRWRSVEIDAFPGHWSGTAVTKDAWGRVVACSIAFHLGYLRNTVALGMPRSCLGGPTWVRAGIRTTIAGINYVFTDDARSTGLGPSLVYGPRIKR